MSPSHSPKTNWLLPVILLSFFWLLVCLEVPTVVMGAAQTEQNPPAQNPAPEETPTPEETATPEETPAPTQTPAPGQTPTPDPAIQKLDNRIKELEKLSTIATKEKEIAVSEAERVTAEKNKLLNALPTPTATPLEGKTTVEGSVVFQSELLAYKSLSDIAGGVGEDMAGIAGAVVIHNDADIRSLQAYSIMLAQIKTTVDQYNTLNRRLNPGSPEEFGAATVLAAPQVVSTLLRSVADVAALFRTDTTITGLTIAVDESVLNAQVAEALRRKGFNVFEPKLFLPNLFNQPDSEIVKQLGILNVAKARGEQTVAEFDALSAEAQKASPKRVAVSRVRALNTQVDAFINALMQVDEATKQSPMTGLYRAERLRNLLDDKQKATYVLHLKLAKAEGDRTTKSNLFTGTKLSYSGGMIVSYTLFDRNGQIVRSGIHASYRGSSNSKPADNVLLKLP